MFPAGQPRSRFVQGDFKFAHFAVSELDGQRFHFTERTTRGAFGEAGFGKRVVDDPAAANRWRGWTTGNSCRRRTGRGGSRRARLLPPPRCRSTCRSAGQSRRSSTARKASARKRPGLGNASHYYSFTRLETSGNSERRRKRRCPLLVHGDSWFDHEWASNQLAGDQVGWDWFCFQFDDGAELMLYAMRRRDGSVDPVSAGTFVDAGGQTTHLKLGGFPTGAHPVVEKRRQTDATYPIAWKVTIPGLQLEFALEPALDDQELVLPPISYWEGAIRVTGQRAGNAITGNGVHGTDRLRGSFEGACKSRTHPGRICARAALTRLPDMKTRFPASPPSPSGSASAAVAHAGLQPGANVLPSEVRSAATGEEYCQMCAYSSRPATVAIYGKLHDEAFWTDAAKLQALQDKHKNFGFFAQVLDSTDAAAIQAEAKKHGITFPVVYTADPDFEKVYQVGGVSRTVYYSTDFKIGWSGVGVDDAAVAAIEAKIKADPQS